MPSSNEINWPEINQVRLHHSVSNAIEILRNFPRQVEELSLSGWSEGSVGSSRYVVGPGVVKAFYRFDYLHKVSDDILPVILAEVNGKNFVLDGAHRLAKWVLLNRPVITVVRLNSAESKSCIRPGMEAIVAALKLG